VVASAKNKYKERSKGANKNVSYENQKQDLKKKRLFVSLRQSGGSGRGTAGKDRGWPSNRINEHWQSRNGAK